MKLQLLMDKFVEYCMPKNETLEINTFFTCMQKADQSMDQYVTEVKEGLTGKGQNQQKRVSLGP